MPWQAIVTMAATVLLCVALPIAIHWYHRRYWPKRPFSADGRHCTCGYLLVGLEVPRCPECGRMIGFNKPPAELGVSEQEMRAAAERRKATRGSSTIP